jgi:pimeloyl-ACP methyl ester carboxylesterase
VRVLLLHGMGGGVGNWDALAALLAPHLELWDVRLPWAIGADQAWARDTAVTQWVADPVEQIRRTTGRDPEVVVAHSFAANLILELLAGSDLLSGTPAILISPFCRGTQADLDWSSVIPSMKSCFARVEEEIRLRRGSRVSDDIRKTMVQRAFELMGAYPPLRFYQVYMRTAQLGLETLTTPLLLVGGGDDIPAAVQSVAVLGQRIPPARAHIIEGCGHFPMTERPAEVARLIEDFINGSGRPAMPASSPVRHQETPI